MDNTVSITNKTKNTITIGIEEDITTQAKALTDHTTYPFAVNKLENINSGSNSIILGSNITNSVSNNIIIGASSQASSSSVSNEITIGNSSNNLFRMPGLGGSNGQVLTYDNGNIEFADAGGGGVSNPHTGSTAFSIGGSGVEGVLHIQNYDQSGLWVTDTRNYLRVGHINGPLYNDSSTAYSDAVTTQGQHGTMRFFPNHQGCYFMMDLNVYARMWCYDYYSTGTYEYHRTPDVYYQCKEVLS